MASITVTLTVTEGGAVLIGVLIHIQQPSGSFEEGFKTLTENFPLCFEGLEVK